MILKTILDRCSRKVQSGLLMAALAGVLVAPKAASAGGIEGRVAFEGEPPARQEAQLLEVSLAGARNSECKKLHRDAPLLLEDVIVGEEGGLANVVVYVKKVEGDFEPPAEPALLDQVGCAYTPHVLGMQKGQTLAVKNSDPLVHNVRSFAEKNRAFNMGQTEGNVREKVMRKAELAIKIKCDIHRWMTSYLFVFDHPFFAITDESGAFSIEGVPAGDYTLVAWHEVYGKQTADISVGEDGAAEASFSFKAEE